MKKMLLLVGCVVTGTLSFAQTPEGSEIPQIPGLEAQLEAKSTSANDSLLQQCGLLDNKFYANLNPDNMTIGLFDFTVKASLPYDPQNINYSTEKKNFAGASVFKGRGGTVYVKRYSAEQSIDDIFNIARKNRNCSAGSTFLFAEHVIAGVCKYDNAPSKEYSVTKFILDFGSVYEFTFVPSRLFDITLRSCNLLSDSREVALSLVRNTDNVSYFFHTNFFQYGEGSSN